MELEKVIELIIDNKALALIALGLVYELLIRFKKTGKSLSIINAIIKVVDVFIPNRSQTGGKFINQVKDTKQ